MICQPCTTGEHGRCDDVVRQQRYIEWLATQKRKPQAKVEPTRGCPCLHRVEGSSVAVA